MSVLQQGQHEPASLAEEVLLLYALSKGLLHGLTPELKTRFQKEIYAFARKSNEALVAEITAKTDLGPAIERALDSVLADYFGQTGS